jgi:hypothetical protein
VITATRDEVLAWGAPSELDMAWTTRGDLECGTGATSRRLVVLPLRGSHNVPGADVVLQFPGIS